MESETELTDNDRLESCMKLEQGGTDRGGFKRAIRTMRVLITIFLVLDFALACFVAAEFFHV
jgi:hypothetical protein